MTTKFQPLLASPAPDNLAELSYPVRVSPKYDGVRAFVVNGVLLSRKLKPIRNKRLQELLGRPEYEGLDGELVCGNPTARDVFQRSQSMCSKADGPTEDAIFFVFDKLCTVELPFAERLKEARQLLGSNQVMHHELGISLIHHPVVKDVHQLEKVEADVLKAGFEGLMVRDPNGRYKLGRSTTKEGILLKVKRFNHDEAEIFGAFEQLQNNNEATVDERGYKKRSSAGRSKPGSVTDALLASFTGKNTLGGFHVKMLNGPFKGVAVDVGTGWTDEERKELWTEWNRLGFQKFKRRYPLMRVKHQLAGAKDKPRFPVFDGWRAKEDMS